MDQTLIKDLLVRGIIGINEEERHNPQDILINIAIFTDTRQAGKTDNISDCVNYRTVTKKVIAHAEKAQRLTVEALANDIAQICLQEKNTLGVKVRVEKPGAVRFARSVGVEIERMKDEK
jgi:FolB domain-containing protein